MKLDTVRLSPAPTRWLRRFFWLHPEWWSLALALLAWGFMLVRIIPQATVEHVHGPEGASSQAEFINWCLMIVAMMVPIMVVPLRWVAFQSFRYRRHQAIFFFLVGFLTPWLMVGGASTWLRTFAWSYNPLLAPALFALAALWVLVPIRMRALVYCHLTVPLVPSGWKADRDCLWYGIRIGVSCVVTCGVLMLACAFTGHSLIAILGATALILIERRSFRPPTHPIFVGTLQLAVWFLLL